MYVLLLSEVYQKQRKGSGFQKRINVQHQFNYEVKWHLLFPFCPKYRANVFLILFDSLYLRSDGDWNSCSHVFFVQHLYDKKASRTKRAMNHLAPLWSSWQQKEERELEEGKSHKLLDPTCMSLESSLKPGNAGKSSEQTLGDGKGKFYNWCCLN